ncbi:MAG: hypothetical protein Q7T03_10450 [Deltaproteobacteria bacterium]|nr:hypothetical protein [Deltaproteobacteria bacterium]
MIKDMFNSIFTAPLVAATSPLAVVDTIAATTDLGELSAVTSGIIAVADRFSDDNDKLFEAGSSVLRSLEGGDLSKVRAWRGFLVQQAGLLPQGVLQRGVYAAHRFADRAPVLFSTEEAIEVAQGIDWSYLIKIATGVFGGDPVEFANLQRVTEGGFAIQMELAMENAIESSTLNAWDRNRAMGIVLRLEKEFDLYKVDPRTVSVEEKWGRVDSYVKAAKETGLILGITTEEALDYFFNLIQIREFLQNASGVLEPFKGEKTPAFLGDFLLGRVGKLQADGACHPMAMLAGHLGRRIGIELHPFFSEGHVNLLASRYTPFIFEPYRPPEFTFLPHDFYSAAGYAPPVVRGSSWSEMILCQFLQYEPLNGRDKPPEDFYRNVVRAYPRFFYGWLGQAAFLANQERYEEAEKVLGALFGWYPNILETFLMLAEWRMERGDNEGALGSLALAHYALAERIRWARRHRRSAYNFLLHEDMRRLRELKKMLEEKTLQPLARTA